MAQQGHQLRTTAKVNSLSRGAGLAQVGGKGNVNVHECTCILRIPRHQNSQVSEVECPNRPSQSLHLQLLSNPALQDQMQLGDRCCLM